MKALDAVIFFLAVQGLTFAVGFWLGSWYEEIKKDLTVPRPNTRR